MPPVLLSPPEASLHDKLYVGALTWVNGNFGSIRLITSIEITLGSELQVLHTIQFLQQDGTVGELRHCNLGEKVWYPLRVIQ